MGALKSNVVAPQSADVGNAAPVRFGGQANSVVVTIEMNAPQPVRERRAGRTLDAAGAQRAAHFGLRIRSTHAREHRAVRLTEPLGCIGRSQARLGFWNGGQIKHCRQGVSATRSLGGRAAPPVIVNADEYKNLIGRNAVFR